MLHHTGGHTASRDADPGPAGLVSRQAGSTSYRPDDNSDDNPDDNPDDSCTPNNAHNCPKMVLSCLVTHFAWSWQSRDHGSSKMPKRNDTRSHFIGVKVVPAAPPLRISCRSVSHRSTTSG
ncbi:hypothetical protein JHV675_25080 [Mycobacterium avium subsp. hominissuis]